MKYEWLNGLNLNVEGRISLDDAMRQDKTAKEILMRLERQPGLILADEVGMGKTFVALAVAVSVAIKDPRGRPAVVMVPPSLKEKWPRDFEVFRRSCLPEELVEKVRMGRAERAIDFLKLVDDPPSRIPQIIFVTHGAMSRGLTDPWTMLAFIRQAIYCRRGVDRFRKDLAKVLGELLHCRWVERKGNDVWLDLLSSHPKEWLKQLEKRGIDPENDDDPDTNDDPVPRHLWGVLQSLNTDRLYQALQLIPRRDSLYWDERLRNCRHEVKQQMHALWAESVKKLRLRLPLLILDEAHHLKNARTVLASLFHEPEALADAQEFQGALHGVFERMLFLTATPFQLGHGELCSILERFEGIDWKKAAPDLTLAKFQLQVADLRKALDESQAAAIRLDHVWGGLRDEDLRVDSNHFRSVDEWWNAVSKDVPERHLSLKAKEVLSFYRQTQMKMARAEELLKPWVIRHLKSRTFNFHKKSIQRRMKFQGRERPGEDRKGGIPVADDALLPFLLAVRAASQAPESRPLFAEGLSSSYEAFRQTRSRRTEATDLDDEGLPTQSYPENLGYFWYLQRLDAAVPKGDIEASISHPKLGFTVEEVTRIWKAREKIVVFCHFIETGKALRSRISYAIRQEISRNAASRLSCNLGEAERRLEKMGERIRREDSVAYRVLGEELVTLLAKYPNLKDKEDSIRKAVISFIGTPSFLVRYFPIEREPKEDAIREAIGTIDGSGMSLRTMLDNFFAFLSYKNETEREHYILAMERVQTGAYKANPFDEDEIQGEEFDKLLPNVRLVNGATKSDTRQRLMLMFNTPFFPDILIASSVLAEGVDLHLNARHIIHHDLCWNPSTLEQRTGRVDRIGSKAETCGHPIYVYLPFIEETQDEKMFRVVMDRERWFNVLMGEKYKVDLLTTEKLSQRVSFPEEAAKKLTFKLQV